MSWYLANTAGTGDQFASGASFDALRDAAAPYASLMQFLDDGITKNVELCETQLRQLAERTDDGNAKRVALNLADLMKGQDLVAITQGFGAPEEPEAMPIAESLREAAIPKHQAARNKALRSATKKIIKLTRSRFRAQRKAVLDSHALGSLHVILDRAGHHPDKLSEVDGARRAHRHRTAPPVPDGDRSRALREDRTGPGGPIDREASSDGRSQGQAVRRVTGSVDAPLTDAGRQQMESLRDRVGSDIAVFTAPNSRSRESGRIVNADAQDAEWLRPWGLGRYEGLPLDAARDATRRLVMQAPDESPGISRYSGKEGDSFNTVTARLIAGTVAQRATMKPGARVLNITSGRALHIIHAAARNAFQSVDKDELVNNPDFSRPGDLFKLYSWGLVKLSEVAHAAESGQYFAQHGETDWNEGVAASEALREADDPDRAALEAEIAAALGEQVYTVPVTQADQDVFTGAIKTAVNSGSDAAADMLSATAPQTTESFVAEYLKDGGFSRLTGDLDQTTVDNLASAVADAYESGADFDGVVQAVKDSFAQANSARAAMIAQTELNDAWNQSVVHFGKEAGATKKSWAVDLAPCIVCVENAADGSIDFDEDFASGDDAPPAHPNCCLPDTVVTAIGVSSAFRRRYKGEVCVLSFTGLPDLSVTPNHPILTRVGWISAGELKVHDDMLQRCGPSDAVALMDPNNNYIETRIEEVFNAFSLSYGGAACGVPISTKAFHGDRSANNEVDVVNPAGKLRLDSPEGPEDFQYFSFADSRSLPSELLRQGRLRSLFESCDSSPDGSVRGFGVGISLCRGESGVSDELSGAGIALLETDTVPVPRDRNTANSDALRNGEDAFPFEVRSVKITKIERRQFDGHVYNLETNQGFYFANSILVHNCNCSLMVHA